MYCTCPRAAEDALITGYRDLIPTLHLPDPGDRHVLAAAIRGQADVIVTANVRDFPPEVLAPFVLHFLTLAPDIVLAAARDHRERLKNPPQTVAEYLAALKKQRLTQTICTLRPMMRP
jgi:hypothetical protein